MKKLLIIFFIVLGIYFYQLRTTVQDNTSDNAQNSHVNNLIINQNKNLIYNIAINNPIELDFLTKQKVFDIRKKYAAMNPEFIPSTYSPSDEVFGRIEDNKPWWGLEGSIYKGSGSHSINGLSEESRFINNPLLLFGIDSFWSFNNLEIDGPEIYIKPVSIAFEPSKKTFYVVYDYSGYKSEVINFLNTINIPSGHLFNTKHFGFECINARDFGYNYAYAYSATNIEFDTPNDNLATSIHQLGDFMHTGGSCGYPGGCNNASPYQDFLYFILDDQSKLDAQHPAQIGIKLWKKMPSNENANADINFIITLK